MRFSPNTTTLLMLHAPQLRMKLLSPTVVAPSVVAPKPRHIVWIPVLRRNKSGFVWQPPQDDVNEELFTMDDDDDPPSF
jgi:hypothetical protein